LDKFCLLIDILWRPEFILSQCDYFCFQTTTSIPFVRHCIWVGKYCIKNYSIQNYFSYFRSFMEKDIICSETVLTFKNLNWFFYDSKLKQFITFQLWSSRRHCWTRNTLSGDHWTGFSLLLTFNSPLMQCYFPNL
jgi:hypothetical protein